MSNSTIDDAIMAVAKDSWRKVAMIISQATKHVGGRFAERKDAYEQVAARIRALVDDGRLLARGDVMRWRHSEVRHLTDRPCGS